MGVVFLRWRSRETGRSRAVSPLNLGGNPLQAIPGDNVGDSRSQETDPEDGWRAIWRVVQKHKDRQALERKAAKEASSFEYGPIQFLGVVVCNTWTETASSCKSWEHVGSGTNLVLALSVVDVFAAFVAEIFGRRGCVTCFMALKRQLGSYCSFCKVSPSYIETAGQL